MTVEHELNVLNRDVARYGAITRKAPEDILLKQGGKLAFYLSRGLKALMPGKGVMTQERVEALGRGEGVYVRPQVRQSVYSKLGARSNVATRRVVFGKKGQGTNAKGQNLQALAVKRELALRESGRGFISFAARFGGLKGLKANARQQYRDRYKKYLASVGFHARDGQGTMIFSWGGGGSSDDAAKVLRQPEARAQVQKAIASTSADIRAYNDRKMRENARKAFR